MSYAREPALEGVWAMVRAEFDGERAPALVVQKTEIELAGGHYAVRFAGEVVDRGSYKVAAAAGHGSMSLHGAAGPNAGRTIACIYQLVGDRLRICYGLDGAKPDAFSTRPEQQRYLATYRRKAAFS
jgi:uncharacterized protein (TIGR03067 family)